MATTNLEYYSILDILNMATGGHGGTPFPKPDETHRYYACQKTDKGYACQKGGYNDVKRVVYDTELTENPLRLISIKRGCPEICDPTTLSYKLSSPVAISDTAVFKPSVAAKIATPTDPSSLQ
jgi:hypothetical protein